MNRITAIVQSMMASPQEVSYTRRDRLCPPLGARPLGPALWYRTLPMMATCMPVMCAGAGWGIRDSGCVMRNGSRGKVLIDVPHPSRIPHPALRNICPEQIVLRRNIVVNVARRVDSTERREVMGLSCAVKDVENLRSPSDRCI